MSQDIGDTCLGSSATAASRADARPCQRRDWSSLPCSSTANAAEVAARYGVHRSWVYRLKARYDAEGEAAFEPRSRRPRTTPNATPAADVELVAAAAQAS